MERSAPIPGDPGLNAKYLFTDASYVNHRSVAAWAGMIIAGHDSALGSGLIESSKRDNTTFLELCAMSRALLWASGSGLLDHGDRVILLADNQDAIAFVRGDRKAKTDRTRIAGPLNCILRIRNNLSLTIDFEWIAGHQGHDTEDWRGLIHGRVDRQARFIAREACKAMQAGDAA